MKSAVAIVLTCAACATPDLVPADETPSADPTGDGKADGYGYNLHAVTSGIYRSARPSYSLLSALQAQGVRTVVDLETSASVIASERAMARDLGLAFISLPLDSYAEPDDYEIQAILDTITDPDRQPVLVHCHYGKDRTGLVIGLYRVWYQSWWPSQAYNEMLGYGFDPQLTGLRAYFRDQTGY